MPDRLWDLVSTRCSPILAGQIADLQSWLGTIATQNAHAAILCGKAGLTASQANEKSASELETRLIHRVGLHQMSKQAAADWLRLLYLAEECWNAGSRTPIANTRLARLPAAQPSPFKKDNINHLPRVEAWRQALQIALRHGNVTASAQRLKAATMLSALLFGALIDSKKLCILGKHAGQPAAQAGSYRYIEFNLPYAGMGNHHIQRWYPDPMTSLLLWHPSATSSENVNRLPMADIKAILTSGQLSKAELPRNASDLITAAAAWWQLKMAPIDLHGLQRKFLTHSIHPRTWRRLHRQEDRNSDVPAQACQEIPGPRSADQEDLFVLYPWLLCLDDVFNSDSTKAAIEKLPKSSEKGTTSSLLQAWLEFAISGNSSTKQARSLKTLAHECIPACSQLLASFGDSSPLHAKHSGGSMLDVLMDAYQAILSEIPQSTHRKALAVGLREFHYFLVKNHKVPPLPSLGEALGEDAGLLPVDANLITFDDYEAAQAWLEAPRINGKPQVILQIAQLVLMFAFRLGIRRQEIWGLLLDDVDIQGEISIIIRPNTTRRLKSPSSQRTIPAEAFLSADELKKLKAWVDSLAAPFENRKIPEARSKTPLFPAEINGRPISAENISKLIFEALRAVTGDPYLYLHHLRHAFGTWTYLRLRAPDYPMVCEFFSGYPLTLAAIQQGSELRRRLIGTDVSPSRKYAYAVARLLGHSSPAVSMAHYLHGDDLVWASIVQQRALLPDTETYLAVSTVPRSTAFAWQVMGGKEKINLVVKLAQEAYNRRCPVLPPLARRGRPRKEAISPPAPSDCFEQLFIAYQQVARGTLPLEQIAEQFKLDIELLQRIQGELDSIPGRKKGEATTAYCLRQRKLPLSQDAWFNAIRKLHHDNPSLFENGTRIYLENYYTQHCDVVFRGKNAEQDLRTYLTFLKKTGLTEKSLRYIHRVIPPRAPDTAWASKLRKKLSPNAETKTVAPPNKAKADSYARWLGLQLTDQTGKAIGLDYWIVVWLAKLLQNAIDTNTSKSSIGSGRQK